MTRGKLTRVKRARLKALEELAARKLGTGAVVRAQRSGWIAERVDGAGRRTRVTGGTRDTLEWFLNEMPDAGTEGMDALKAVDVFTALTRVTEEATP